MAQLSPLAERLFRRAWDDRNRAWEEGDRDAYDAAAFTINLALGRHPNEAAERTLTAIIEQAKREVHGTSPEPPPRPKLSLVPAPPKPDGRTPVEQLAVLLGLSTQQVYRRLPHMPGVRKTDPSKKKSHWVLDPHDVARRWKAGEPRKED
jgi:hypothetical protein